MTFDLAMALARDVMVIILIVLQLLLHKDQLPSGRPAPSARGPIIQIRLPCVIYLLRESEAAAVLQPTADMYTYMNTIHQTASRARKKEDGFYGNIYISIFPPVLHGLRRCLLY